MTIVIALGGNALLRRGDRRPEDAGDAGPRSWF
jgi:carbamate kinase